MSHTPLTIGQIAPSFSLSSKNADGLRHLSLQDSLGKENVVLLFFPMAFTGGCTTEMCSLTSELNTYRDLNATVYGISGDSPFSQEAWAMKEGIQVSLLSDYDHAVARAYGVAYDSFLPELGLGMAGVPKRAAFVIDAQGIIQHVECNDDPKVLPDFEKIKACLASLK